MGRGHATDTGTPPWRPCTQPSPLPAQKQTARTLFICGITLKVKPGRPHHLLSWGNEEDGGSAGSKAKAGELQWPTGHHLPVNWVFCYWELLEGKLVFSHIHLKHPVEQQPENWVSAPGRPQTWWLSYAETPYSLEDTCLVTTPAEADLQGS